MVDVKASCNTGNSAWAIVKPDILPPFRRHRLLSSGHERKKCKFHHNSNEGTKHITKNIHFMICSYWWFLFIQHNINCKWSHNARLICACSAWRSLAPNCCSSFFWTTAPPCNVKSNNKSRFFPNLYFIPHQDTNSQRLGMSLTFTLSLVHLKFLLLFNL